MSERNRQRIERRHRPHRPLVILTAIVLGATAQPAVALAAPAGPAPGSATGAAAGPDAVVSPELLAEVATGTRTGFMVYLRERADLSRGVGTDADLRARTVFSRLTETATHSQRTLRATLDASKAPYESFWIANAVRVEGDRALVAAIAALPEVERIEPSRSYPLLRPEPVSPADGTGTTATEWNLTNVGAPEVWTGFGARGDGVVVASIDSGVQWDHPALLGSYRGSTDSGSVNHNYHWFDPAGVCPDPAPCDNNGHGTHTTGTIVGDDGAGNQIGVAPAARWIAAKGCETDSCSDASLLAAGQFVLAPTDLSGANPRPDLRADVVNNSWGGGQNDLWYQQTIDAWVAAGIFPTFAVGNDGPACGTANSPGDNPAAYAVGAYDMDNVIAARSSRGASTVDGAVKPNIAAPGVAIRSSIPGGGYASFSGTSMATPHVSGAVALLWSAAPALRGDVPATRALLDLTATDTDDTSCGGSAASNNTFGAGRLDAYDAVSQAPRGPTGQVTGVVTGAGEPLAGATVSSGERGVTTGPDGRYTLTLPAGEHTLTANAYGYTARSATVTVPEEQAITQDFALVAATMVTLSGQVTDGSGHGWPLYARVDVAGRPDAGTFTDPATGRYSITVPGGSPIRLVTTTQLAGYQPVTTDVPPGEDDRTVPISVPIATACTAPGYTTTHGAPVLGESFTGTDTPDGWSVVNRTSGGGWAFEDLGGRGNLTGGSGGFAIVDSDSLGVGRTQDSDLVTPALDLSAATAPYLRFNSDWRAVGLNDSAEVDVSVDGGTTWASVWRQTASLRGPRIEEIPLTVAAGSRRALVRFRFQGSYAWWWQVDDVQVTNRTCTLVPGGLLVGVTTDHNTGATVNGVTVASVDEPSVRAVSGSTPDDPALGDGFYQLFSPLTGDRDFTASRPPYQTRNRTAMVVPDSARRANFSIKAGRLAISPSTPIESHQPYGSTRRATVTVTNTGSAPASVEMLARGGGFDLLSRRGAALAEHRVKGISRSRTGPRYGPPEGAAATASVAASVAATVIDEAWTRIPDHPAEVFDNAAATLDGRIYSVGGGTGTGTERDAWVFDPVTDSWAALPDLATARSKPALVAVAGKLYLFGGWGADGQPVASVDVYDPETSAWSTLSGVSNPAPRAAAGAAVVDDTVYLVGGCVDSVCTDSATLVAFDVGTGSFRTGADYPLAASWLACGGIGARVYCAGGVGAGERRDAYAYHPTTDSWSPLPDLPLDLWGGQYAAAGGLLVISGGVTAGSTTVTNRSVAYDPVARSWLNLPNAQYSRYRGAGACGAYKIGGSPTAFVGSAESERLGGLESCAAAADVTWLSSEPAGFTLAPGASRAVTLTLTATAAAGVEQPGRYTATLGPRADTPYPVGSVAVEMNVSPPASWAKVRGTVHGLACSGDQVEVAGATIRLTSLTDPGTGHTLRTDAAGGFAWWLPRGRYEIITAKDGWVPQARRERLPAGIVTTVDTVLDPVDPCPARLGGI